MKAEDEDGACTTTTMAENSADTAEADDAEDVAAASGGQGLGSR